MASQSHRRQRSPIRPARGRGPIKGRRLRQGARPALANERCHHVENVPGASIGHACRPSCAPRPSISSSLVLCGDNFRLALPPVFVSIDACKKPGIVGSPGMACPLGGLGCVKWAGGGTFPLWAGGPTGCAPGEVEVPLCFWCPWAGLLGHGP